MRAELDLVPSTCSSSYSYMNPASDAPIDNSGPMSDSDASLPLATDILISQPPLHSIPTSDFYTDSKTNPADILHVAEWDLRKTQTVDFATMVKMFLVRSRINVSSRADIDGLTNRVPALMKEADAEYMELLEQAINFCNSDTEASSLDKNRMTLCKYVKQHMRAFCNAKVETDRYLPMVNVLNAILSLDDGSEVVFIRNEGPMFVESIHLPTPKTKPGVVLVELESGKKWLGIEESGTPQQCRETAGEVEAKREGKGNPREKSKEKERDQEKTGKGKAEVLQEETHAWTPIKQFWEFKMGKKLDKLSPSFRSTFEMENLTPPTGNSAAEGVAKSSSMPAKRQHSDNLENPRPTKRAREASVGPGPATLEPDDDVQCAYYAIELLRVSWKASHASGVLLKDELLEILWYDPQGCIRTIPIDIVKQLPLLVVLVRAQRRSKYLSGLRETLVPGDFELIDQAAPRFQLVGRMSSWGKLKAATPLNTMQIDEDEPTHFFKSSWPEDIRPKEHEVIAAAVDRANEHLPDNFRHFVLDHLPTISASDEIYDTSTAIIRILLGLSMDGARTHYLMSSKLLSNLLDVADKFALFKGVLRDVVRAHRLLWVIGIAHGDVSFHNIMTKPDSLVGVLNDFDLASVMKPGATSPPKVGFRRTGTPMFMAAELLCDEALSPGVPRFYRHDLESFAWILLYASVCVKDGVEKLDVDPFRQWVSIGTSRLYEKKMLFLLTSLRTLRRVPDNQWLLSTFAVWVDAIIVGGCRQKLGPGDESALLGRVLRAWKIDKEEWEDFSLPAVQG